MAAKSKLKSTTKESYLAIPYHILNAKDIGLCQKMLLAHVYSFGEKGCYQSNRTLADIFMVSAYTVSRWLSDISRYLYIKNPKGYYRTMWAKSHPDVRLSVQQWSGSDGKGLVHLSKSAEHPKQKCSGELGKSAIRLHQDCITTTNNTNTETNKETTAPLSPLPAGGQAPAVLAERGKQVVTDVEGFKKSFGFGSGRRRAKLTEEQFEKRKAAQLKALRAS